MPKWYEPEKRWVKNKEYERLMKEKEAKPVPTPTEAEILAHAKGDPVKPVETEITEETVGEGRRVIKIAGKPEFLVSHENYWCPRRNEEVLHEVVRELPSGRIVGYKPISMPVKPTEPIEKKLELLSLEELQELSRYIKARQQPTPKSGKITSGTPLRWDPVKRAWADDEAESE